MASESAEQTIRLRVRPDSTLKTEADQKLLKEADRLAVRIFNNELIDVYAADSDIRGFLRAWLSWKDERL